MQRLQKHHILFKTQQEESERKIGAEEVLQILQKTYASQRSKISLKVRKVYKVPKAISKTL